METHPSILPCLNLWICLYSSSGRTTFFLLPLFSDLEIYELKNHFWRFQLLTEYVTILKMQQWKKEKGMFLWRRTFSDERRCYHFTLILEKGADWFYDLESWKHNLWEHLRYSLCSKTSDTKVSKNSLLDTSSLQTGFWIHIPRPSMAPQEGTLLMANNILCTVSLYTYVISSTEMISAYHKRRAVEVVAS